MTNLFRIEMLLGLGVVVVTAALLVTFMFWRKKLRR